MAIPFLNSIDLKDYQLLNAKMHVTSTAPTAAKGQIYLDSSDNTLKYHNGTTWVSLLSSTAGTGISVSASSGAFTITNTDLGSSQNIFKNFAVAGQDTVVADSNNDTLTLVAGSNVTITTNSSSDTITISSTASNTTYDLNNTSILGGSQINLVPSAGNTDSIQVLGTASEIEVTHAAGSITVGLPNDVVISGNLTVIGTTTTNNVETVSTSNGVIFEGNAADGNELTLLAGTLTAVRTITLPDATGTLSLTSDLSARTYATTISNTTTITHGLGTEDVIVQLFDNTTKETVYADVVRTSTSSITITFGTTPLNTIRVLVTKIG